LFRSAFFLAILLLTGCFFEEESPENEGHPEKRDKVCVIPGYVVLETQSAVDSFAAIIDTCDKVTVVYLWMTGEDIVSLEGFNDKLRLSKAFRYQIHRFRH
jgi:hypothetical protein